MFVEKLTNPDFKGCLSHSYTEILHINHINPNLTKPIICKDIFMTIPIVIYATRYSPLIAELNDQIHNLKASGLINYWHLKSFDVDMKNQRGTKQPKTIQLHHLVGSFQLFLCGSFISFASFIFETLATILKNFFHFRCVAKRPP